MPYTPSVQSRTTLNTVSAEGATFNSPLFITANQYFSGRTKIFGSWTEVQQDPAIPTTSNSYTGLKLAFSQIPAPARVYLGRRDVDLLTLTPNPVVDNKDYKLTFVVTDDATQTPVTTVASITSGTSTTATLIATALEVYITANVANVTAVDLTGSLTVVPDAGYTFYFTSMDNLVDTYTTTETAADLLAAIQEEENGFYFVTAEDHTEVFQLAMAAVIEPTGSTDFPKMYFTSTQDADTIVPLPDPAIDVIGKLKEFNYLRTVCDWHDQADTIFPEMGDVAYNGVFQPGSTTWKFMRVAGVPQAVNPLTGKGLSTGVQGYIEDRNGNWMGGEYGVDFYREGKTVSGEWIDVVRFTDWLNTNIEIALFNLLLNQKGGKIPNTPAGRQQVASTVDSILDQAKGFNALSGYIPTSVPAEGDISFFDKVNRILRDVKFTGYLAGAIHTIIVDGNLTYTDATI